jgi:opacity protein-like surface antigen
VPQPAAADGGALYLGAGAGYTLSTYRQADLDNAVINTFAASGYTLALSSSSVQNQHTPWSVDVGYRFSTYFGLEAAYLELGTLNYASAGTATSILGGAPATTSLSIRSHGPALAFVGVLPLTDAFGLEARLGAYEGKTVTQFAVTVGGTPSSGTDSQTSASLLAGVGTSYIVAAHWVVRLGYVHLNQLGEKTLGKSFNVDLLTAGVDYVF